MKYLSVCSGIEAATQAWHELGWQPVAFSEIEKFPSAVLAHHYPNVPNWGDMTKFKEWPHATVDVLVGGTPCQSFSIAGLRKGLDDPRGNLMLTFGAIAKKYQPRWLVWENVPGVLSSNKGRDFGALLSLLGQLGYGFAYRVLDAQYVRTRRYPWAVPQRRRRVFVVGYFGDWRRAAAVLFDAESLSGHTAPCRKAGQGFAAFSASSIGGYSEGCGTLRANGGDLGGGSETLVADVASELNASFGSKLGLDNQHINSDAPLFACHPINDKATRYKSQSKGRVDADGSGNGLGIGKNGDPAPTLTAGDKHAVAFTPIGFESNMSYSQTSIANVYQTITRETRCSVLTRLGIVRRLTPRECERLQGFPDDFTAIPWREKAASECPDGPRYKALGNSMAVNVMQWIGERIQKVENMK
jgi:DNA (cytosine-5)-methyltransferase 1